MMRALSARRQGLAVALAMTAVFATLIVACGGDDGEDRPGTVSVIGGGGAVSGSVSGVSGASGSGSGVTEATTTLGDYQPVSDVAGHARITLDVAEINALLSADPIDFEAVRALYEQGKHSIVAGGGTRTLAAFARNGERAEPIWDEYVDYFGEPTWLDSFIVSALDGAGPFAGEPDAVRKQGVQKGIQNQLMVAWVLHELVATQANVADGNLDPNEGAPHSWDEGWAFYRGVEPDGAPFATADKRGANFGTGSTVNDAILAAFQSGLEAAQSGDVEALNAAVNEIVRQITITYVQAAIRYARNMEAALDAGDDANARVEQAEGWSFFRVIAPLVAAVDPSVAAKIDDVFNLEHEPSRAADGVQQAIESVYDGLGISDTEVGTLQ